MSGERLQRMVDDGLERGLYLGASFRVFTASGEVLAGGVAGRAQESPDAEVTLGTVWDLASITKPMATATSILILAQEGAFHLGEELRHFLPGESPHLGGITLRHCLTHTTGFKAWAPVFNLGKDRAGIIQHIRDGARVRPVGRAYEYSDFNYILLGEVVHHVTGKPLAEFAQERIYGPLGMTETLFNPSEELKGRIAATYCAERKEVLVGSVHDANAGALEGMAGHAGLFSTLDDMQTFGRMVLNGGEVDGVRVLCPLAVERMKHNQNPAGTNGHTFGWFIRPNGFFPGGDLLPDDAFGHSGFTGPSLVLCPSLGLGVILLTNRVYQRRDASDFLRLRRRFHNVVAGLVGSAF